MRVEKDLVEVYFDRINNDKSFNYHYDAHVLGVGEHADNESKRLTGLSKDEYDELANTLSETPAGDINSDDRVVGYVSKNGYYVKYDKKTNLLVVYNDNMAVSLYKMWYRKFQAYAENNPKFGYASDLPEKEKKKN